MENHNFYRLNQLFLWPFSIAIFVYQRVTSELYLLYISWNITVDFGVRTWFQAILLQVSSNQDGHGLNQHDA